jgi:hypothetical protein
MRTNLKSVKKAASQSEEAEAVCRTFSMMVQPMRTNLKSVKKAASQSEEAEAVCRTFSMMVVCSPVKSFLVCRT